MSKKGVSRNPVYVQNAQDKYTPDILPKGTHVRMRLAPTQLLRSLSQLSGNLRTWDDKDEEMLDTIDRYSTQARTKWAMKIASEKWLAWKHQQWKIMHDAICPEEECSHTWTPPSEIIWPVSAVRNIILTRAYRGMNKARVISKDKQLPYRRGEASLLPHRYDARESVPCTNKIPGPCTRAQIGWGPIEYEKFVQEQAKEASQAREAFYEQFDWEMGIWAWGAEDVGVKYISAYDKDGEYIGDKRIVNGTFMGELPKDEPFRSAKYEEGEITLDLDRPGAFSYHKLVGAALASEGYDDEAIASVIGDSEEIEEEESEEEEGEDE